MISTLFGRWISPHAPPRIRSWLVAMSTVGLVACAHSSYPQETCRGWAGQVPARLHNVVWQNRAATDYRMADAGEIQGAQVIRRGARMGSTLGMALEKGDEIRTDASSNAVVCYANGSMLYLRPGGQVRIGSAFAVVGELFARVRGFFQVDTEFVTAGAEGTEYVVKVLPGGETIVYVLEGRVNVISKGRPPPRRSPSVALRANEQTTALQRDYSEKEAISPDDLMAIRNWVGQIDQALAGPQARGGVLFEDWPFRRHHRYDRMRERPDSDRNRPDRDSNNDRNRPDRSPRGVN